MSAIRKRWVGINHEVVLAYLPALYPYFRLILCAVLLWQGVSGAAVESFMSGLGAE